MKKSVIEGIIQLSNKMNLTVVAEGVESKKQYEFLLSIFASHILTPS